MKIKILSLTLGATAVMSQILLLRECAAVFYGNETAYAIILASWLFWGASGSFLTSRLAGKIKNSILAIGILECLVLVVLPVTILFLRSVKLFLNVPTGEMIGLGQMSLVALLALAPLTFIFGSIFILICRLAETERKNAASGVEEAGSIYSLESLGAALGGILLSFVLIRFLPAVGIAFGIAAAQLIVFLWVSRRPMGLFIFGLALVAGVFLLVTTGQLQSLERFSRNAQWKGFQVLDVVDSLYGNIALVKRGEDYSLYENGLLSFTTGDELSAEESVHFSLLAHENPRKVLLVGNGLGGALQEILKYPGVTVDYVELDPEIVKVAERHLPEKFLAPLKDSRVVTFYQDARLFVKKGMQKYDVIIVNLANPSTALLNRYYSLEFFQEAQHVLSPGGVLSLSVASSENYLSKENRLFLRSLHSTLGKVFKDVAAIPGGRNVFLAFIGEKPAIGADFFIERLKTRHIPTKFVSENYLPFQLSSDRIAYIDDILKSEGTINTDTRPVAYLYDIVLWSTHFNSGFQKFIDRLEGLKFWHLLFVPFLVFVGGWRWKKKNASAPMIISIVTTGFCQIIFQVIVIVAFQTLYGYAYYKIGLIIASFMAGLAAGSFWGKRLLVQSDEKIRRIYKISQAGMCLYSLLLPLLFVVFRDAAMGAAFAGTFAALPVIAGFLGGLQYPLASHIVHKKNAAGPGLVTPSKAAGLVYALDILGASVGALVTGALLIPLLGISAVAYFCLVLNLVILFLL